MRLVHADVLVREELLILMHSLYPTRVALRDILQSMSARSAGGVEISSPLFETRNSSWGMPRLDTSSRRLGTALRPKSSEDYQPRPR